MLGSNIDLDNLLRLLGKPQKSSFYSGPTTKREGGKGPTTKEKGTFYTFFYLWPWTKIVPKGLSGRTT